MQHKLTIGLAWLIIRIWFKLRAIKWHPLQVFTYFLFKNFREISTLFVMMIFFTYKFSGEGGKLKPSLRLIRGKDFELIPERLWRALIHWYGGAPAVRRQVISRKNIQICFFYFTKFFFLLRWYEILKVLSNWSCIL